MRGRIKNWNEARAFGFITGEDRNDYFFHISAWHSTAPVNIGFLVTFTPQSSEKGLLATDVIFDETALNAPTFVALGTHRLKLNTIKRYGIFNGIAYFVKVYSLVNKPVSFFGKSHDNYVYKWTGETLQLPDYHIGSYWTQKDILPEAYTVQSIYYENIWSKKALKKTKQGTITRASFDLEETDVILNNQKYLLIETFQNETFRFYEGLCSFNLFEKQNEIDNYFKTMK